MRIKILFLCLVLLSLAGCREDEAVISSTDTDVAEGNKHSEIKGFFLLNEGNMGSNKATLDYYDYETGTYTKNIYAERNPGVVQELGDVGNDLQIYGDKLYAVINCSHFVEVMDVATAKHITQISIPNCRYITFDKGYAYVSSYAGPVAIDPNARLGYVAKVDTATMEVVDSCVVGYQPEEMAIVGNKLYVANSGGYRVPHYDRTVSVVDLDTFKEIRKIDVAINLHRVEADRFGRVYVSSRGDYGKVPSDTYVIDTKTDQVVRDLHLPNSEMEICGDSLYVYNYDYSRKAMTYTLYDVLRDEVVAQRELAEGMGLNIEVPYGIAINPETKEVFLTDAKDYVTPGKLYCFDRDGHYKWAVTTGDIPAHFAFTKKILKPLK